MWTFSLKISQLYSWYTWLEIIFLCLFHLISVMDFDVIYTWIKQKCLVMCVVNPRRVFTLTSWHVDGCFQNILLVHGSMHFILDCVISAPKNTSYKLYAPFPCPCHGHYHRICHMNTLLSDESVFRLIKCFCWFYSYDLSSPMNVMFVSIFSLQKVTPYHAAFLRFSIHGRRW